MNQSVRGLFQSFIELIQLVIGMYQSVIGLNQSFIGLIQLVIGMNKSVRGLNQSVRGLNQSLIVGGETRPIELEPLITKPVVIKGLCFVMESRKYQFSSWHCEVNRSRKKWRVCGFKKIKEYYFSELDM